MDTLQSADGKLRLFCDRVGGTYVAERGNQTCSLHNTTLTVENSETGWDFSYTSTDLDGAEIRDRESNPGELHVRSPTSYRDMLIVGDPDDPTSPHIIVDE